MNGKTIVKLIALNLSLLLVNVVIFSKGILGFSIFAANILIQAAAITIPLLSAGLFAYGNYRLLKQPAQMEIDDDVLRLMGSGDKANESNNVREALHSFEKTRPSLRNEISRALQGMDSIDRKQEKMERLFVKNDYELALARDELNVTESILCQNIKKMMNRLILWEPAEENDRDKAPIYEGHRRYIDQLLGMNEKLLDTVDELLVEVANYLDARAAGTDMQSMSLSSTIEALKTMNGKAGRINAASSKSARENESTTKMEGWH